MAAKRPVKKINKIRATMPRPGTYRPWVIKRAATSPKIPSRLINSVLRIRMVPQIGMITSNPVKKYRLSEA